MGHLWWDRGNTGPWLGFPFPLVPLVPITAILIWLGFGIRQWMILFKWTTQCELYKELQKKIDAKLDYEDNDEDKEIQS